jgi:hypothetical protein
MADQAAPLRQFARLPTDGCNHVACHISDRPSRRRLGVHGQRRFLEPFPTHDAALAAARTAAAEQRVPGHSEVIEYEDEKGRWHTETAAGSDRPDTDVEDTN